MMETFEDRVAQLNEVKQKVLGLSTIEKQGLERVIQLKQMLEDEEARVVEIKRKKTDFEETVQSLEKDLKEEFVRLRTQKAHEEFESWLQGASAQQIFGSPKKATPAENNPDKSTPTKKIVLEYLIKTDKHAEEQKVPPPTPEIVDLRPKEVVVPQEKGTEVAQKEAIAAQQDEGQKKDDAAAKESSSTKEVVSPVQKRRRNSKGGTPKKKQTKSKKKAKKRRKTVEPRREPSEDSEPDQPLEKSEIQELTRQYWENKDQAKSWRQTRRVAKLLDDSLACDPLLPDELAAQRKAVPKPPATETPSLVTSTEAIEPATPNQPQEELPQQQVHAATIEEEETNVRQEEEQMPVDTTLAQDEGAVQTGVVGESAKRFAKRKRTSAGSKKKKRSSQQLLAAVVTPTEEPSPTTATPSLPIEPTTTTSTTILPQTDTITLIEDIKAEDDVPVENLQTN